MVVWALVDFAWQKHNNRPKAEHLRTYTTILVNQFEGSLGDELNGRNLKNHSGSLFRQICIRNENQIREEKIKVRESTEKIINKKRRNHTCMAEYRET